MAVIIRPAVLADVEPGAKLHVETWQSAFRGMMPRAHLDTLKVEEFAQRWRDGIASVGPTKIRLVAEENGQLLGFAGGGPARWEVPGFDEELFAIYVHPSQQGRGVGRRLLAAYMDWLRGRGKSAFVLWVLKDNHPSRRFYEAVGGEDLLLEKADRSFGGVYLPEVAYGWRKF